MSGLLFHMIGTAPEPVAPFSHATEVDGWVFLTGQLPIYPGKPQAPLPEGIEAHVLAGLRLDLRDVVRVGAYLAHFDEDYGIFNRLYQSYFEPTRLPARTCIGVSALARGARVEIDLIARRP